MGEYASRGSTHAGPSLATGNAPARAPELTPAERAQQVVAGPARELTTVRASLTELEAARVANDLPRWQAAKHHVDQAITQANRRLEEAHRQLAGLPDEARSAYDGVVRDLATETGNAYAAAPPAGYTVIDHEPELLAVMRWPGDADFTTRWEALRGMLDELGSADLRALRARIASPKPFDELARAIWSVGPKHRDQVSHFIENVDRRKARERAAAARRPAPAPAPEPETLDTKLRRAFAVEMPEAVRVAISELDATERAALLRRIRSYRQGNGDDVAARFQRLARDVQAEVIAELERQPSGIAAPVASAVAPVENPAKAVLEQMRGEDPSACERDALKPHATRVVSRGEALTFVLGHEAVLIEAITDRITLLGVPEPHARLHWTGIGARSIARALREDLQQHRGDFVERIAQLVGTSELVGSAQRVLARDGSIDAIATEIAIGFDHPLTVSVLRIGARVRAAMDLTRSTADPSSVVVSNHLDRIVANAMTGRVAGPALTHGVAMEKEGRALAGGARTVTFEWLGESSGEGLWNWIRVTSPHDATAEDVASTPIAGGRPLGQEEAYRIAASPPYFGLPVDWARQEPGALAHAPAAMRGHAVGPAVADAGTLARSVASDGAALAQAPAAGNADLAAEHAIGRLELELGSLQKVLGTWHGDAAVTAPAAFIARRKAEIARDPHRGATWAPVLTAQERIVGEASDALASVVGGHHPGESGPRDELVAAYARVIEVSHLDTQARAALAEALRRHGTLQLKEIEHRFVTDASHDSNPDGALAIAKRAADLEANIERGHGDAEATDSLIVDSEEHALRGQLDSIEATLAQITAEAGAVGSFEGGLPTLDAIPNVLRPKVRAWRDRLDAAKTKFQPKAGLTAEQAVRAARRDALAHIGQELEATSRQLELEKYVAWAQCTIADRKRVAEIVKVVARLAAEVVIMMASMQLATAALTAVRGVMLGIELAGEARAASTVFRVATAVVGSGINTTATGALFGADMSWRGYAENAIALGTATALMAPFEGLLAANAELEQGLASTVRRAVRSGRQLVLELGTQYAGGVVGHLATRGLEIASPTDGVFEQGFTYLVGKFVHQRVGAIKERLQVAERELGAAAVAGIRQRVAALGENDAAEAMTSERAQAQLRALNEITTTERALYRGHAKLERTIHDTPLGAGFAEVPLVLAQLEPVVHGESYLGTRAHIDAGIRALSEAGLAPESMPSADPTLHLVKVGGKVLTLKEVTSVTPARDAVTGAKDAEPHFTAADRKQIVELDRLERELAETRARAAADTVRLEHQIAQVKSELGIAGESEVARARARAVDVQRRVLADAPRRTAKNAELAGELGHSGVDVHSHFMGIVEPEVFRRRAAAASGMADSPSWVPLLDRIAALKGPDFQHEGDGGKIERRAKAGDAVRIARDAEDQVRILETRLAEAKTPEDIALWRRAAETVAEEASRTALTASPETSFDGAYEVIDALVKDTFGRPRESKLSPAEHERSAFDDYIEQALLRLAETGTTYSEQSTGFKKLKAKVSPQRIEMILERLIQEDRIPRGAIEIKMLGMVGTRHYGEREKDLPPVGTPERHPNEGDVENRIVIDQNDQAGVVGRDIGGPEAYKFNQAGIEQAMRDLVAMQDQAKGSGEGMVDRPHVGEGSIDTEDGKPFHTDKDRRIRGDKPAHYERARHNIDQLLTAAEELRKQGLWDPTKVITRFGHVTHATPAQAARMESLGIYAEVNLTSNIATGSLSQTDGAYGPRARAPKFEDHSLPTLIYYRNRILVGTDGPGVMATTLRAEYERANQIIEAVLAGEQPIRVRLADATVGGRVRGQAVAEDASQRAIYVDELTDTELQLFLHGYEQLYASANHYLLRRPKPSGSHPHHTTIATSHGLTSKRGHAWYEGPTANVRSAADAYRQAGYRVRESGTSDATLMVVVSIPEVFTTTLVANEPHHD